jgi:hypothetical protein
MANKGFNYEREIAKRLSEWWTGGKRDDIFWRGSGSGGRATTRTRRGKKTANSYGDILVQDSSGFPLMDLITFELKKGYTNDHIHAMIDRMDSHVPQTYEVWIDKAIDTHRAAESFCWMIIQRRTKRQEMVFFPLRLWRHIESEFLGCSPFLKLSMKIRTKRGYRRITIVGMTLHSFLVNVRPKKIRNLAKRFKRGRL